MKKLILAAVFLLLGLFAPVLSAAQCPPLRPVTFRTGLYTAANIAENRPLAGAFVSAQGCNVMAEIELGWSYLGQPRKDFMYISPALGFYYGEKFRIFGLAGLTNWAARDAWNGKIKADSYWWKLKIGIDIPLGAHLFITASWQYVIDSNRSDLHLIDCNAAGLGIGYKF